MPRLVLRSHGAAWPGWLAVKESRRPDDMRRCRITRALPPNFPSDDPPRSQRLDTTPDRRDCLEDEMHMMFECRADAHIRLDPRYTCSLSHGVGGDMTRFFRHDPQKLPADLVTDMTGHRHPIHQSQHTYESAEHLALGADLRYFCHRQKRRQVQHQALRPASHALTPGKPLPASTLLLPCDGAHACFLIRPFSFR